MGRQTSPLSKWFCLVVCTIGNWTWRMVFKENHPYESCFSYKSYTLQVFPLTICCATGRSESVMGAWIETFVWTVWHLWIQIIVNLYYPSLAFVEAHHRAKLTVLWNLPLSEICPPQFTFSMRKPPRNHKVPKNILTQNCMCVGVMTLFS